MDPMSLCASSRQGHNVRMPATYACVCMRGVETRIYCMSKNGGASGSRLLQVQLRVQVGIPSRIRCRNASLPCPSLAGKGNCRRRRETKANQRQNKA